MYQPKLLIGLTSSLIMIVLVLNLINFEQVKAQSSHQKKNQELKQGLAYLNPPLMTQIENQHKLGCSCPNCLSFQLINQ